MTVEHQLLGCTDPQGVAGDVGALACLDPGAVSQLLEDARYGECLKIEAKCLAPVDGPQQGALFQL